MYHLVCARLVMKNSKKRRTKKEKKSNDDDDDVYVLRLMPLPVRLSFSFMSSISFNALFTFHFLFLLMCHSNFSATTGRCRCRCRRHRQRRISASEWEWTRYTCARICELNRIAQQNEIPNYSEGIGNMVCLHLSSSNNEKKRPENINAYLMSCAIFNKLISKWWTHKGNDAKQ